ncbi:MAG: ribonuclease HII, partial [Mesonia sp.]
YIVVPEENGTLHILDRVGDSRVKVKEKIDFSNNAWYLHKGLFTSSSLDGKLIQISESGKLTQKNKNFTETNRIDATSNTLVSLSENELRIKGKEVNLDFGLYTAPKIFYLNNKIYIALTDTQTSKVYVFDSQAELLSGFPVYGNSQISIENIDAKGRLEFIVKGEDDSVLIYQMN